MGNIHEYQKSKIVMPFNKAINLVKVQVVFGSPKNNCIGTGICDILIAERVRVHWKCPNAHAIILFTGENKIALYFHRRSLTSAIESLYFSNNVFEVEYPYRVSSLLLAGLLGQKSCVIYPGRYTIKRRSEYLIVEF